MFDIFKHPKADVLIVGGGPVGLFAALSLVRRGVKVRVIEEEARSTTHSYALALHPATLELLDEVGLASAVLERSQRLDKIAFYDGPERYADVEYSRLTSKFPMVAILPQNAFEDLLTEALLQEHVTVEWGHRLASIANGTDCVEVTVHKLEKQSAGYGAAHQETVVSSWKDLKYPFVLGADGHDSVARQQLDISFDSVAPTQHFAVVEFDATSPAPNEARVVLDETTTNVLWSLPDGRCRWSFQITDRAFDEESRSKDRLLMQVGKSQFSCLQPEYIHALIAERAPWFREEVGQTHFRIAVRFEHRLASKFGNGRVWLAGDAAHMAGPVGVQSMNVGLREAAELAKTYAAILHGEASAGALSEYGANRLSEWRDLLGISGAVVPRSDAPRWVAERAERLRHCIPASGAHLKQLLAQLGLSL